MAEEESTRKENEDVGEVAAPGTEQDHVRGGVLYIAGATAAMLAAGTGWRLLDPPLAIDTWELWPLAARLFLIVVPLAMMVAGTVYAWSSTAMPKLTMAVLAGVTALLFAPTFSETTEDLLRHSYRVEAAVLRVYDCDRYGEDGRLKASLTCVELSWPRPDGKVGRDRFSIADSQIEPDLAAGQCAAAVIWPANQRLVSVKRVPPGRCR